MFNKQITLFREAVFLLFGYRLEMASDPAAREFKAQFVLRPQHADGGGDSAGQQLVFRMLRDNRMVLVPSELRWAAGLGGLLGADGGSCCSPCTTIPPCNSPSPIPITPTCPPPPPPHPTHQRSGRLAREVDTFIERFRSIPAFTANLTMELFQKQTQC